MLFIIHVALDNKQNNINNNIYKQTLLIKRHNKVENTNNIDKQRTISILHKREVASELLKKYSHPCIH